MQILNQNESVKTSYRRSGVNLFDLAEDFTLVRPAFELFKRDSYSLSLVIRRNARLCYRLNELTKRYPSDTKFRDDDEPLFLIKQEHLLYLKEILEIKDWSLG